MFFVITHQAPQESIALFRILKSYINSGGLMLFTAFIERNVEKFVDVVKDQPLMVAQYDYNFVLALG